jgi:glycine/D-amino acid oxidase-like deaminating enzyme
MRRIRYPRLKGLNPTPISQFEFHAIDPSKGHIMARTDAIVLGAGIVGVSVALHLVKRGLAVALIDRGEPGHGTSYGNAGIIEANTLFPAAFPSSLRSLMRIAFKQAPEANYHASFLARVAPWLLAFRCNSTPVGSSFIAATAVSPVRRANAPLRRNSACRHASWT